MIKKPKTHKKAAASQNGDEGRGTPIKVPQPTYQLPPEGVHTARLVGCYDIGTHYSNFADQKKQPKVILTFELPEALATFVEERGPEPFHQSIIYTNSLGERSNLYRDIVAWQGKGAIERLRDDLGLLVSKACALNLIHETTKKGTVRSKVIGIAPLSRGTKAPPQISPSLTYSISDGVAGGRYDKLPVWVQKMIMESIEIGGERPSKREIIERNVREATANASNAESARASSAEIDEEEMNRDIAMAEAEGY